jgi:hypothetical protein
MLDWEIAENIAAKLLKGSKRVVGSGNKLQKGDVISPTTVIEVKQTNNTEITLQYDWFRKLEKRAVEIDYQVLAITFYNRQYYYVLDSVAYEEESSQWTTKKVSENALPEVICTLGWKWTLEDAEFIKSI